MQIEERVVDNVTILDLKGKITLGEGDEVLKDKINSLVHQDRKRILLNFGDVPYVDSAGLGEIVRYLHDRQPPGRPAQAGESDETDHRPAEHHEASDRLRDVRFRAGSVEELFVASAGG